MEKKFSRASNFSTREENILINLVKTYKEQVECKKSDASTNKIKTNAWINISKEFNSISGESHRSHQILKNKYENIKKRAKQKYADNKKYITGTGGGPSKDIIISETDTALHDILGTQLTGLTSEFDNDTTAETIVLQFDQDENFDFVEISTSSPGLTPMGHEVLDQPNPTAKNTESSPNDTDWAKYTPAMLRMPVSSPLRTTQSKSNIPMKGKKSQGLGSKLEEWASHKSHLTGIEEKSFLEKHTLTIHQMEEKHRQYLSIQKDESQVRIKCLLAEHEMKIKILEREMNTKYDNNNNK